MFWREIDDSEILYFVQFVGFMMSIALFVHSSSCFVPWHTRSLSIVVGLSSLGIEAPPHCMSHLSLETVLFGVQFAADRATSTFSFVSFWFLCMGILLGCFSDDID